jgi:hypothetical protein
MEPATVLPLNLEKPDTDSVPNNLEILEVNHDVLETIDKLKKDIYDFKEQLYHHIILADRKHEASDLGSMISFHSIFLQAIAYFIGMLDSQLVPEPKFTIGRDKVAFLKIKEKIKNVSNESPDSRILVYSLLFQFSTQHAFDMGTKK